MPGIGRELFRSTGLGGKTALAANLAIDALTASSAPQRLLRFADRIFFAAEVDPYGLEPYVTDGSESGTRPLGDLYPGKEGSNAFPRAALGRRGVFTADTPDHGIEPWVTDGTLEGTRLLGDLIPGPMGSLSSGYVRLGQQAIFAARSGDLLTPSSSRPTKLRRAPRHCST